MIYITQPTYLPWIGYFSFLDKANEIVFLDDVQFAKRSWQQRNRILFNDSFRYLTVPVISKGKRDQLIKDVKVYEKNFFENHLKIIEYTYKKTPYFKKIFELLSSLSTQISIMNSLSEINILLIEKICDILNIKIKYSKSSELNVKKKKSYKLAEICKLKFQSELISNEGTVNYINEDIEVFKKNNINIHFYQYDNINYQQTANKFVKQLSILDLIFNEGPNSIKIIRSGLNKIRV